MAGTSLQIDDDYCKKMGKYFIKEGKLLETYISEYIDSLERIQRDAIMKGDVADSLTSYIQYAKKLEGKISEISELSKNQTNNFVKAVDKADQYLF